MIKRELTHFNNRCCYDVPKYLLSLQECNYLIFAINSLISFKAKGLSYDELIRVPRLTGYRGERYLLEEFLHTLFYDLLVICVSVKKIFNMANKTLQAFELAMLFECLTGRFSYHRMLHK